MFSHSLGILGDLYLRYFQVGAGLPVIASVTRIIASGDPVSRIVGSLSGMQLLVYYVRKGTVFLKN